MLILVANKSDLFDVQVVSEEEGVKLAEEINATFILTSAKLRIGVDEIPETILSKCISLYGSSENWKFHKDQLLEIKSHKPSCCVNKTSNKG